MRDLLNCFCVGTLYRKTVMKNLSKKERDFVSKNEMCLAKDLVDADPIECLSEASFRCVDPVCPSKCGRTFDLLRCTAGDPPVTQLSINKTVSLSLVAHVRPQPICHITSIVHCNPSKEYPSASWTHQFLSGTDFMHHPPTDLIHRCIRIKESFCKCFDSANDVIEAFAFKSSLRYNDIHQVIDAEINTQ